jgi:iron complex transport system substrate-binding protein
VVSLSPAVTEILLALGGPELVVARVDHDRDPQIADRPSVGLGLAPSIEVIAAARPELVLAWEEEGAARVRPQLEELGIAVFAVRTQDTTDVFNNIRRIGRLVGREAKADSLSRSMRAGLDSVRASVAGLPAPSVLYVAGVDPLITVGPNSFLAQLVGVAGGRTVFPDLIGFWPRVSPEDIVRRQPDVLIVPVRAHGPAAIAGLRSTVGLLELVSSGKTRVQTVPAELVNRPGPAIAGTARLLRDAIHPPPAVANQQ